MTVDHWSTIKRKRGLVTGKKASAHVGATKKRILVEVDGSTGKPPQDVHSGFIRAIGAWIRDKIPMNKSSYDEQPNIVKKKLYDHLSATYEIPLNKVVDAYITIGATSRYKQWKSDINKDCEDHGQDIRLEFLNRPDEWEWLLNHFNDEKFKAKSRRMKEARKSEKKFNHTAGSKPFVHLAEEKEKIYKSLTPRCDVFVDVYKKYDPEGAAVVATIAKEVTDQYKASQPQTDDGSTGVTESITLPIEMEINVIQKARPHRRGTVVSGLGATVVQAPKSRGGPRNITNDMQSQQRAEVAERKAEEVQQQINEMYLAYAEQTKKLHEMEERQRVMDEQLRILMSGQNRASGSGGGS